MQRKTTRGCRARMRLPSLGTPLTWGGTQGKGKTIKLIDFDRTYSGGGGLFREYYGCYRFRKTIGDYELFFAVEGPSQNKTDEYIIVNAAVTRVSAKPKCKACGARSFDACERVGRKIMRCSNCPGGLFGK